MALWDILGSNVVDGTTYFSVWAPNALEVRMNEHPMTKFDGGIWSLSIDEDLTGYHYSYNILTKDNVWITKFDPMSKSNEVHPERKAIVYKDTYQWQDSDWLETRKKFNKNTSKLSIYEMHINSWILGSTYTSLKTTLIPHLLSMGFTHVQFLPINDHPFMPSWGYQVTGLYAPSAFWGSPDDLKSLIDELHQNNIGVIFDLVTYHFPADDFALSKYDGTYLYEQGPVDDTNAWGTLVFAWDKPEIRNFLLSSVRYWIEEYHFDGIRVDAVAVFIDENSKTAGVFFDEIVPSDRGIDFVRGITHTAHQYPGVFCIAEESRGIEGVTSDLPGLKFDYKYSMNLSWHFLVYYLKNQYDLSEYIYRFLLDHITDSHRDSYVWEISHDVLIHGTGSSILSYLPGSDEFKMTVLESYLMFMFIMPGGKMIFMGTETAGTELWDIQKSIEWDSPNIGKFSKIISELNSIYTNESELTQDVKIEWIVDNDYSNRVFAFSRGNRWAIIFNFSENRLLNYELPLHGNWELIHTSDHPAHQGIINGRLDLAPGAAYWFQRM
jgi:1,4-alpha-glucan branching enzyme